MLCAAAGTATETLFEENFDGLASALRPAVDESVPSNILGWTHEPPPGWSVDTSAMADGGMTEWRGWSFVTLPFWVACENQGRDQFVLGENVFAVADSDEYDDKDDPPPFDSTLISPAVTVPAGKTAYVSWDCMYRPAPESVTTLSVSVDGGPDRVIRDYHGQNLSNTEETVEVPPPDTGRDWTLVLKWRYRAKNGWFWAIDNVRVTDTPPTSSEPLSPLAGDDDWPTYMRDAHRSGVAPRAPRLPLELVWEHRPDQGPRPAWPAPARADILHSIPRLSPTTTFDRAFHPVVVGDRVYYASSADDSVHCIDLDSGRERWTFSSEGPVRLAPTVTGGRVYFGSDDGFAYCVDARSGALIWKRRGGPRDERLPGNERIVSLWPVRSGVAIAGETAYFTAGLFPLQGVYLCAVNAATGEEVWTRQIQASPQGYMLASPTRLFLPTGRTAPLVFDRRRGRPLGPLEGRGGSFAILLEDMVAHGPGEDGRFHLSLPATKEYVVSAQGLRVVAREGSAFILSEGSLSALDRGRYIELSRHIRTLDEIKARSAAQEQRLGELRREREACVPWRVDSDCRYAMILAGDTLFTGGDGKVVAVDSRTGEEQWRAAVDGKAYALAAAQGRLLVGCDTGVIHCFGESRRGAPSRHASRERRMRIGHEAAEAATAALGETPRRQGFCFVLGADTGELACAVAQASEYRVVVVESDPEAVARVRASARALGLSGERISAHAIDPAQLPYREGIADLVLFERALLRREPPAVPAESVNALLCPAGGTAVLAGLDAAESRAWGAGRFDDWDVADARAVARRGPLPGAGEWTHTHADPGNSACSGDTLVASPVALQWFGPPGPDRMVDRHFRNVPPLAKDGRLFVAGDECVFALNAYNGALLWQAETPGSLRVGVFLDSSNMMVDESHLHVAAGDGCRRFDVETGAAAPSLALPARASDVPQEWGYLARSGDTLLGSRRLRGATYNVVTREAQLDFQAVWYPNMKLATSVGLFACDPRSGELRWEYPPAEAAPAECGRIIDAAIAADHATVYFVETHASAARSDTTGRLAMLDLIRDGAQYLVALDLATGTESYRRALDMNDMQQPVSLVVSGDRVVLTGSRIVGGDPITIGGSAGRAKITGNETVLYTAQAFDAKTGDPAWQISHDSELPPDGGHGEYNRHPVVVAGTVHLWPYAYDLRSGQRVDGWKFDRRGHGCGGVSASEYGLFWRGDNPWMYDLRPDRGPLRLTAVTRPGCWINIIPAGGLVLIPEASAGCTCPYPIQTSLAFAPRAAP